MPRETLGGAKHDDRYIIGVATRVVDARNRVYVAAGCCGERRLQHAEIFYYFRNRPPIPQVY